MTAVLTWLRLDLRRRWTSLLVLALLIALAGATVLTALAGARRGASSLHRLVSRTLPTDAVVLPNQPKFNWAPFEKLPYVQAVSTFVVYQMHVKGIPNDGFDFPRTNDAFYRTIEKSVVFSGHVPDLARPDEVVITPGFARKHHISVGSALQARFPDAAQVDSGANDDLTWGQLRGPTLTLHVVGVVRSPWLTDLPGESGQMAFSPALFHRYTANILGRTQESTFINAMFRLKDGAADIPRLRADVARLTGRTDVDVWNMPEKYATEQKSLSFEARCLAAFGIAALLASLFLVGQAVSRYAATSASELQIGRALGMTPLQVVAASSAALGIAGAAGAALSVVAAGVASRKFPIGSATGVEPSPGTSWDWEVLLPGAVGIVLLVLLAAVLSSLLATRATRPIAHTRRSSVATAVARAGLPVPVLVGTRFALEPGRGKSSVPVRPAIAGAIAGVLGVIAAFSFSGGVHDAISHPERFGQTYQAMTYIGFNGQDLGPADKVVSAVQRLPEVAGLDDARLAVATSRGDGASVALLSYDDGMKRMPTVVLSGRMPQAADEVLLAPGKLQDLHAHVGDSVSLTGTRGTYDLRIVGSGFVPVSPHNDYNDGGWLTRTGFDSLFKSFKFHFLLVSLNRNDQNAAGLAKLNRDTNAAVPGLAQMGGVGFVTPHATGLDVSGNVEQLRQVRILPIALGIFLVALAVAAVGHALATAVRRRAPDIAVLRAVGMTPWQSRWIVAVQASVLVLAGLAFGVPIGLALGRTLWHSVANYTPLQYVPPTAWFTLSLIAPVGLLVGNALAAMPARRAARTRVATVLRAE